jgi:hypothetical protein
MQHGSDGTVSILIQLIHVILQCDECLTIATVWEVCTIVMLQTVCFSCTDAGVGGLKEAFSHIIFIHSVVVCNRKWINGIAMSVVVLVVAALCDHICNA